MFFSRAFDSSCISIAGVDTEELDENYISLDQVDIGTRQVGGVNPAPVDLDINGFVMDRHFDHVALRFGSASFVFFVQTTKLNVVLWKEIVSKGLKEQL